MKYTLVLALLAPLASAANLNSDDSRIPASVRTLNELHRGPPMQLISKRANVETRWISQKLDNFDEGNEEVWDDRVLINEDYFVDGSPIFIYLGGEWEIEPSPITAGHWVDIASEHNGSLVYTEHRFFGQSVPIKPLTTANLKYQNVEQALADVVNVINVLKEEEKYKNSKVVVQGCSYSATMAVWIKKLYPDVIVGSWASSAPLQAKVDFKAYMKVVGQAYRELGGDYCYNIIDNATSFYEDLFENGQNAEAKKLLNLCDNFNENDQHDQWQIFSTIANILAGLAQYQNPANYDLAKHCSVLRSFSTDDATALSKFIQWRLDNPECVNTVYKATVKYYKWAMHNYDGSGLSWFFQTCNEFGWYQSSGSKNQPFGSSFPATLYTDTCKDVFGSKYTAAKIEKHISEKNKVYGGVNPNVENVYMTHGGLDPWHPVGAGAAQGATIIPQASHCSDMGSISAKDSPAMIASKQRVAQLVREWLA
ncbi:thymus-specific serine protease [Drosophila grimshawi]|uniref:GH22292 n=1 Tax=Drosophila grimshawi TaxID=7222 RepID=B4JZ04_DROGR|nr:thymus-specific serine protease [Drosophila grimshawi]EDV98619.1 GH22292 [Drosophila grimshawi]